MLTFCTARDQPAATYKPSTSLSPRHLMLLAKSSVFFALQSAPSFPGTVSLPVNAMYMTSLASWPLSPERGSSGKHNLAMDREASPGGVLTTWSLQITAITERGSMPWSWGTKDGSASALPKTT
ncbi:hypothetical protein HC256_004823 [Beauveria bassiana]|nr:hypothetical protein HC256_004823 [Beauveria bassiana]